MKFNQLWKPFLTPISTSRFWALTHANTISTLTLKQLPSCILITCFFFFFYLYSLFYGRIAKSRQNLYFSLILATPGFGQETETGWNDRFKARAFIRVYAGKVRKGTANNLGLVFLNNFPRLYTVRVVPSCLLSGPGQVIKTEDYCLLGCTGQREEV